MAENAYSSWQPFAVIAATTTAAKIDTTTAGTGIRALMLTLVASADQPCWVCDSSGVAAGTGGAHYLTQLQPGGTVLLPMGSTLCNNGASPYVCMFTGSAGANVIVSVLH